MLDIGNIVTERLGVLADPINTLGEGFNNFVSTIGQIINYINPWSEDFFIRIALVPSEGYLQEFVSEIKELIDGKFAFITEIQEFLSNLFGAVIDPNPAPPEFTINLPGGKWGSGSVQIIDFSIFAPYRTYILNFIRVTLWIPFLLKLYRRLSSMVYL